jgi:hypothetical protein
MRLLDAVNLILPKLGEHRVTRLDVKHPTLAVILPEVDNELRTLLNKGWWFNEFNITLHPNTEGHLILGSDILTFTADCEETAVQRGAKLYNPNTLSYVFQTPVSGRVRQYVEFDDLPESAAQAVYYSALVAAYVTDIGLTNEVQDWKTKAFSAYSDLLAEHIRQKKFSTRKSRQYLRLRRAMRG